jgi:hypothetical protein
MTFLAALGEFPEMVLGLALSLGCAFLLGFVCLRFLLGLMTRQQAAVTPDHNVVVDDPGHARSLLLLGAAVGVAGTASADLGGGTTGGPYLLPAASTNNRFIRASESDGGSSSRVVELPVAARGRVAQAWTGDGNDAA